MSLSSLNLIGQSLFELQSRNENVDEQTDVGHINLIGGLVTHNPPKNGVKRSKRLGVSVDGMFYKALEGQWWQSGFSSRPDHK